MRHGTDCPRSATSPKGSLDELVEWAKQSMIGSVVQQHAKGACVGCDYNAGCEVTGFHVSTAVARKTGRQENGSECPHIARDLFQAAYLRVFPGGSPNP